MSTSPLRAFSAAAYFKRQSPPMPPSAPALLIIDMQKGMRTPFAGRRNNPQAEASIAKLLNAWRQANAPIVHIRHISRTSGSLFSPGQAGVEFQEALAPLVTEHVVEKNVPCAFTNSGLERWLKVRAITALVIVGVSTNNSVEATARTAGNLGFRTAAEVHVMSLANLDGEYAQIARTEQALREL